jgi:hypothetical protein
MADGTFALPRLYGGKKLDWQWDDASPLMKAWESRRPVYGTSCVYRICPYGMRRYKPISYEARRTGEGVMVLWGNRITRPHGPEAPLFRSVSS